MVIEHEKVSIVKDTPIRFSIFVIVFLLLIGIAAGTPIITNYAPESPVTTIEGETRDFNIGLNQNANVSWYINGTLLGNTYNDSHSTHTIEDAVAGTWMVNATATNENGTFSLEWIWIVRRYGVNLTEDSTSRTSNAGINASYLLVLHNNGTVTDAYLLSVVNADSASTAALNISENITLESGASQSVILNVTNMSSGIFSVNVTARSNNDTRKVDQINTTTTVTAVRGVHLTNVSSLSNTVIAGTNSTYYFSMTNNGSDTDTYNIEVISGGSSEASLNITSPVSLNPSETMIFTLNVTNTSAGIFSVNATATSAGDATKSTTINTTTTVSAFRGVQFTNVSSLRNTVIAGTNATYYLSLTNNGTDTDTYTMAVTPGGASETSLNIISISLNPGETSFFKLNVTNATAGIFSVNVTAISDNDPTKFGSINTVTNVINATGSVNGIVTDVMLGTPIDNAIITLTNTTGGTFKNTTDTNGFYYIPEIVTSISDPYIYTISATKTNYTANSSLTVTVNSTTSNTTNITLRAYNVTLIGSYIKNGTSIEVSGVTVSLTNTTIATTITRTTDASGRYSASIYPAIYFINVSKTEYSSNSISAMVSSNLSILNIPLSPNTVTVTANRTVGSAESGQFVRFNLTVVNTGENATFSIETSYANASTIVTNTTAPSVLLLNTSNSTGYVVVELNNGNFGGWPVTITISNSSQSKSASVTLTAIMRNSNANYSNDSISVIDNASVTGGATLRNTTVQNATVIGASMEDTTVQNGASVSGNDTDIRNATVTGENTQITDGAVIKGEYGNSYIDNSTVGNATVVSSNMTGSTIRTNAKVTNSTLAGAIVDNTTLTNVTVRADSTITNVASLSNITLGGVTVTGDSNYEYEGKITGGNGWVTYQNINFTKVYDTIRISQLVIEQSQNMNVGSGTNISINDTSLGTSMNFSMTVNLGNPAVINISETGISPDGAGFRSGTRLGNFLVIRSNDTLNVTRHILRLYFDTDPSTYTGGVAIYYYSTKTSGWEALATTGSGTEGGRYYREAQPNHFSTFALVGTTMYQPTTSGGDGSSYVGVVTSEPYDNIVRSETYKNNLVSDKPVVYIFKLAEHGIYEIAITGKEIENNIALRIEALKGPTGIAGISAPPGIVYENVNVWSGSKNVKKGLIKFKVENSWISNNKVESGDLLLVKWDGSQWIQLVTLETMKDDRYSFFEANTDSFTSFAITALRGVVVPAVSQNTDKAGTPLKPAGTETPGPVSTKKIPGFEAIIAVFALALFAACLRQHLK